MGLNTVTAMIPTPKATRTAGVRNCQAETSAALAIDQFVVASKPPECEERPEQDRQTAAPPARCGATLRAAISNSRDKVACSLTPPRRIKLQIVEQKGDDDHRHEYAAEPHKELAGDVEREGFREPQRRPRQ